MREGSSRSSIPGRGYEAYDGTSMATPHASGAVLLLKEAFPQATGEQILLALYNTAIDLGTPGGTGAAAVDITPPVGIPMQRHTRAGRSKSATPRRPVEAGGRPTTEGSCSPARSSSRAVVRFTVSVSSGPTTTAAAKSSQVSASS